MCSTITVNAVYEDNIYAMIYKEIDEKLVLSVLLEDGEAYAIDIDAKTVVSVIEKFKTKETL